MVLSNIKARMSGGWVEDRVPFRTKSTRGQACLPSPSAHKSLPTNRKHEGSEGKHSIYMQILLISLSITPLLIPVLDGAGGYWLLHGGLNGGLMSSDRWARGGMRLFVCGAGHRYWHSFTLRHRAPKSDSTKASQLPLSLTTTNGH